jgi:hypothetical protein
MNKHGHWCYTYLLGWREHDVWYYGYRGANKVAPENDLPFYLSSSEEVYDMIRLHGYPDVERVHRLFHTKDEAKDHETKFLARVNAVRSSRWLNKHDGGANWGVARFFSDEHRRRISEAKMGHKHSDEAKQAMSESHKEYMQTDEGKLHLAKMIANRDPLANVGRKMSEESKQKMINSIRKGYANGRKASSVEFTPETRRKMSENRKGILPSDEAKRKNSIRVKLWHYLGRPAGGIRKLTMDQIPEDMINGIESHLACSIVDLVSHEPFES